MSAQDNLQIVRIFYEAFNAHDLDRDDDLVTEDYRSEGPGASEPMTRAQVRQQNQAYLTAFPDIHFDIARTIAQGDYVVAHWIATGTHTGPLPTPSGGAIPPTGKSARLMGCAIYEFREGRVARAWNHWDMAALLAQLGVMPAM